MSSDLSAFLFLDALDPRNSLRSPLGLNRPLQLLHFLAFSPPSGAEKLPLSNREFAATMEKRLKSIDCRKESIRMDA